MTESGEFVIGQTMAPTGFTSKKPQIPQNLMDFKAVKKLFYEYTIDREGQI